MKTGIGYSRTVRPLQEMEGIPITGIPDKGEKIQRNKNNIWNNYDKRFPQINVIFQTIDPGNS